jgi:uncharacterized Zn finger protein
VIEVATFRQDDPEILVKASLSCPVCLHECLDWALSADLQDPSVVCTCTSCGHVRRVYLAPDQALRLAVAGP